MRRFLALLPLALSLPAYASTPLPEGQVEVGPYQQGKVRLGVGGGLLGNSNAWNFGLALSVGYFVADNIELGVDSAIQFGDDPFAAYLGPTFKVFFPIDRTVHPYLGAFYRHWFFTAGQDDHDTVGARAGVAVRTGATYFGIGVVYEVIISACEDHCSTFYPELGLSVLF